MIVYFSNNVYQHLNKNYKAQAHDIYNKLNKSPHENKNPDHSCIKKITHSVLKCNYKLCVDQLMNNKCHCQCDCALSSLLIRNSLRNSIWLITRYSTKQRHNCVCWVLCTLDNQMMPTWWLIGWWVLWKTATCNLYAQCVNAPVISALNRVCIYPDIRNHLGNQV